MSSVLETTTDSTRWPHLCDHLAKFFLVIAIIAPVVSIAASEAALGIAVLAWVATIQFERRSVSLFPFWPTVAALFVVTALSLVFSPQPERGMQTLAKFLLFALALALYNVAPSISYLKKIFYSLFALGALAGLLGIFQFILQGRQNIGWLRIPMDAMGNDRITGFMSHWMTYSGELLLVFIGLVAFFLFGSRSERRWSLAALVWVAPALLMTFTRGVWAAAVLSLLILAGMKRRKLFIGVLAAVVLFAFFAPVEMRQRALRSFDLRDPTTSPRIEMWRTGLRMIQAHPWLGVGPNLISENFYRYHPNPDAVNRSAVFTGHLHNNVLQLAAERGLAAAVAFLWLMGWLAFTHARFIRAEHLREKVSEALPIHAAGLVGMIGFFVAGLFEFNFGDSEMLLLFLFFATAPYAAERLRSKTKTT